jgi:hypothetical protein
MHIAGLNCGNLAFAILELNFPQEINFVVLLIPGFNTDVSCVMKGVVEERVLKRRFTSLTYMIGIHFQVALLIRKWLACM